MGKEVKTNAMRILDKNKIPYEIINYECDEFIDGLHTAEATELRWSSLLKHLSCREKVNNIMFFVLPIAEEVDLKVAAKNSRRKIRRNDPRKRYHRHYRLCTWWMHSPWHEKTVSYRSP